MSELLNEFLLAILAEAPAKPTAKKQSSAKPTAQKKPTQTEKTPAQQAADLGLQHKGYGRYGNPGKGNPITHVTQDDKLVPVEPTGDTTTGKKKGKKSEIPAELDAIQKRVTTSRDPKKKESLGLIFAALQAKSAAGMKKAIKDLQLVISPEGKLKAKVFSGDNQKIAGDDRAFARQVYDLFKSAGVEIPGSAPKSDAELESDPKNSEMFKPTSLYASREKRSLDIQVDKNSVTVEGSTLSIVPEKKIVQEQKRYIEMAKALKKRRGEEFTPEYEENIRRYVRGVYAKQNHNVRYLQSLVQNSRDLSAYTFSGAEGKQTIVATLTDTIKKTVPDRAQNAPIIAALDKMKRADNVVEFNKAYSEFSNALRGTDIEGSKKYMVESIAALRTIVLGGTAVVPTSDSFKLADVVSIRQSSIIGDIAVEQLLVDVDEEQTVSAAGSVKHGKGNASGNTPKIENSEFETGVVDGVDCKSVQSDLLSLSSMRGKIFTQTPNGDVSPEAKKELLGQIKKYNKMIRAYYGVDQKMSDEELYDFLSYGKEMVCFEGKPLPAVPNKKNGKMEPYRQAESTNGGQWRAWSVLGKMTDAIHNRTVRYQFYDTLRFNGNVTTADGIRRLSKMQSQHLKNKSNMKDGFTRPDQELNAFTIPSTVEETRNGNPCTQ